MYIGNRFMYLKVVQSANRFPGNKSTSFPVHRDKIKKDRKWLLSRKTKGKVAGDAASPERRANGGPRERERDRNGMEQRQTRRSSRKPIGRINANECLRRLR
ncbi:UNVERIFIED_CONTAM: hypothetical protein PYX00_002362 [Menopon gallinae]|uniref:Uncharacterized protein n=1 Tax=Menopon gallinae TaxID=328185 RepID=A0AAW2IHW0_9NEOP